MLLKTSLYPTLITKVMKKTYFLLPTALNIVLVHSLLCGLFRVTHIISRVAGELNTLNALAK